jgi:hypothetical protein
MWLSIYLAVFAFASLATMIWAVVEVRIPLFSVVSVFAWLLLAFEGAQVTKHAQDGTAITTELPYVQLFCGLMAFSSAIALILYRFGEFPPSNDAVDRPTEQ